MRRQDAAAALQGALALSHEILAVAESGDVHGVRSLDAERSAGWNIDFARNAATWTCWRQGGARCALTATTAPRIGRHG
jgi:hypothetical protein